MQRPRWWAWAATAGAVGAGLAGVTGWSSGAAGAGPPAGVSVPRAECGPGSHPETDLQGRVTATDHGSGYSDVPITCNTELVGHHGESGGFKVERYVDAAGHECAYYDSSLVAGVNIFTGGLGTFVLDMADPANPVQTAQLVSPAMLSPHESLLVNQERGLLAAVMGNPATAPGVIDVYDLEPDCRHPVLRVVPPIGILGHESGWAPDGNTFYATSLATGNTTAVDLTEGAVPLPIWTGNFTSHGMSVSADGTRGYMAARTVDGQLSGVAGLVIVDLTEVQNRVLNPQVPIISTLTWPEVSVPQNAMPVTIGGRRYLVEVDEFAAGDFGVPGSGPDAPVGAARIIDIEDETHPFVVSTMKLEVHLPVNRATVLGDPGADSPLGGYAGHYCGVPQEVEPGIVACAMIESGLRVFDIRDPLHPREIAYFNAAGQPSTGDPGVNAMAMSRPSFVPERGEIWYADGNSGFYAVRITNGVWPFAGPAAATTTTAPAGPSSGSGGAGAGAGGGGLPSTGGEAAAGIALALAALALVPQRARARAR